MEALIQSVKTKKISGKLNRSAGSVRSTKRQQSCGLGNGKIRDCEPGRNWKKRVRNKMIDVEKDGESKERQLEGPKSKEKIRKRVEKTQKKEENQKNSGESGEKKGESGQQEKKDRSRKAGQREGKKLQSQATAEVHGSAKAGRYDPSCS